MDIKLLTIIVWACLVVEASCSLLDGLCFKCSTADFETLNNRLVDNVPSSELGPNLNYVKTEMDNFEGPHLKRAAELLVEVSSMDANNCNADVVSILTEVAQTKLNAFGQKRIERVMREAGLVKTLDACLRQIERIRLVFNEDETYSRFLDYFSPIMVFKNGEYKIRSTGTDLILFGLGKVASIDPKGRFQYEKLDERTGKTNTVKEAQKFEYALKTYLLEPCKRLLADARFNLLLNGYSVVSKLGTSISTPAPTRELDLANMKMAWRKEKCNKFLNMDAPARAKLFRSIVGHEVKQ